MIKMDQVPLDNKRVMIRVDLNVPLKSGKILDDTRIRAIIPTVQLALKKGAKVILLSHLGRPKSSFDEAYSLKPIAERLSALLHFPVPLIKNWLSGGLDEVASSVVLCENVRFIPGEDEQDEALSKKMASLCDVFVMDAFASAHRAHASTVGVAKFSSIAAAGPLLIAEMEALDRAFHKPERPLVALIGGAKVSDKFKLLGSLLEKVDTLMVGGGIANTFLAAKGFSVGQSLFEEEQLSSARLLLSNQNLCIPEDVLVAKTCSEGVPVSFVKVTEIPSDQKVLDIGEKTIEKYKKRIKEAKTLIWNGPMGVFEIKAFSRGTLELAKAIADLHAFSVAGGGETIAAITQACVTDQISHISTGGGAFLAYLEGTPLPGILVLEERE